MFEKLVPVNKVRHAHKRIKQIQGFGFAANFHIASVMVHEFARAAATYPVVFLEDKAQDGFRPVALLGLDAGENLFVVKDGVAELRQVVVKRTQNGEAVIGKGIGVGDSVVVDGQLLLSDGSRVEPRPRKAGA